MATPTMKRGKMQREEAPESGGEKGIRTLSGLDRMATLSNNRIEKKGRLTNHDANAIAGHLSKFVKNTTTAEREVWLRQILKRGLSNEHLADLQERGYGANREQVAVNLAKHLAGRGLEGVAQKENLAERKNFLHRVLTGHNENEKDFVEEDLQDNQVIRAAHLIHGYRLGKGTIGKVLFNAAIGSEAPVVGDLLETARQRAAQDLSAGIMAELQKHGLPDIEEFETTARDRTPLNPGVVRVPVERRTDRPTPIEQTTSPAQENATASADSNVVPITPQRTQSNTTTQLPQDEPFSELGKAYAKGLTVDPHHRDLHEAGDEEDAQNRANYALIGMSATHAFISQLLQRGVNMNTVHNILKSTQELDAPNTARLHSAAFIAQAAKHLNAHKDIAEELKGARQLFMSNEDARSLTPAAQLNYLKEKVTTRQKGPTQYRFNPNVTPHIALVDQALNNKGEKLTPLQKNALIAFHFLRTARHGVNPQGEELAPERLRKLIRSAANAVNQANKNTTAQQGEEAA